MNKIISYKKNKLQNQFTERFPHVILNPGTTADNILDNI
jgi:hypothetical protein